MSNDLRIERGALLVRIALVGLVHAGCAAEPAEDCDSCPGQSASCAGDCVAVDDACSPASWTWSEAAGTSGGTHTVWSGDSTAAAFDGETGLAYVAAGSELRVVAVSSGETLYETTVAAPIDSIELRDGLLAVVSRDEQGDATITAFEVADGLCSPRVFELPALSGTLHLYSRYLGIFWDSQVGETVVDLESGTTTTRDVYFMSYLAPALGRRDDTLYVPSAYPGEVVEVNVDETSPAISEGLRWRVDEDWLHDVKLIDDHRALVAGHIAGIGVVDLDSSTDPAPYTAVSDLKEAYLLVGTERAYGAAEATLACIELDDLTSHEVELPEAPHDPAGEVGWDRLRTTPLGELGPGQVLVHEPGVGLVAADCSP